MASDELDTWHNGYDGAQSQEKIQNQKEEKKKVF
jgi:hypothetical protein